jgi:hypothetical protein
MTTTARTAEDYLDSLPSDRRAAMQAVLAVLRANMPVGYEETMGTSGIAYQIPLADYPETYNKRPLMYVALAAQKNYSSLYLMSAYSSKRHLKQLQDAFKKAGKKLDIGKSCIRFKSADDLELGVIGELVSSIPPHKWIQIYEELRSPRKPRAVR